MKRRDGYMVNLPLNTVTAGHNSEMIEMCLHEDS